MTLAVKITLPWWGRAYAYACVGFGQLFGVTPDHEKIAETIVRHARCKLIKAPK